jgi:glycosyltransferase involved in cell wall biosynthesis
VSHFKGQAINVLHLIHGRSFTGPAASALIDVKCLLAAGHKAYLASRSGTALETGCEEQNVPFLGGFKLGTGLAQMWRLPADRKRLKEVIEAKKIEIVHLHRSNEAMLANWTLSDTGGKSGMNRPPLAVRTWHREPGALDKLKGQAFVCVSREHEKQLTEAGAFAKYIPSGVDTDRFTPRENPKIQDALKIGLIGRWKEKEDRGQLAFIEMLAKLDSTLPFKGVLLGRGEGRASLEALIAKSGSKKIELLETSTDFPAQVRELDLGIVLATGADGSSRPAVELLASGVPLLVADKPGLRELAEENPAVKVLSPDDTAAWTAYLSDTVRNPKAIVEQKRAARNIALERHALAVRGTALAEWYGACRKKT